MDLDQMCGLGRTSRRLAIEPNFHRDFIRSGRVVGPCHVSRGRWDPGLTRAVKVPSERVCFRGCGSERDGFSFTDIGRAVQRCGKRFSNHHRDGRAIDSAGIFDIQRDGVRSHTGDCHGDGVGIGPQPPIDACDATRTCCSTEVPTFLSIVVVAIVEAILFGQVSNVNGVVWPTQHERGGTDGGVVTIPNVHIVDADRRGHSKFPCPTIVGGRQGDFTLTPRGEGLVHMVHGGSRVLSPCRERGAVVKTPCEFRVRGHVGGSI